MTGTKEKGTVDVDVVIGVFAHYRLTEYSLICLSSVTYVNCGNNMFVKCSIILSCVIHYL